MRSGQSALATLAEHGIVEPYRPERGVGPGRPTQYWVAHELIALGGGVARRLTARVPGCLRWVR